jgi:hypothetical protein
MSALILLLATFLQPSNLEGCNVNPRPNCRAPDIPEIQWSFRTHRVYSWPLEDNVPPLDRITYHRQPAIYGAIPTQGSGRREYCLIDEAANTADCYSEWEYQTVATCSTDRYRWIGATIRPAPQPPFLYREDPVEDYWFHRGRQQVYLWEFKQRFGTFPNVNGPGTPRPDITFQADRTQIERGGATVFFFTRAVLFIREEGRLFSGGFDYNGGPTNALPASTSEGRACSSSFIGFTNWCEAAPFRPECQ